MAISVLDFDQHGEGTSGDGDGVSIKRTTLNLFHRMDAEAGIGSVGELRGNREFTRGVFVGDHDGSLARGAVFVDGPHVRQRRI